MPTFTRGEIERLTGTFTVNEENPVGVSAVEVTSTSSIIITLKAPSGGVSAHPHLTTISPGVGFTVASAQGDTYLYNYVVI